MNKEFLKQNYKSACNAYLLAFCNKHEYEYDSTAWVGGMHGEIAEIADLYVDMQTIVDDIDLDVDKDEFIKWYDYCVEMGYLGAKTTPNFRSWIKGCPRKSEEEIKELKAKQQEIDRMREELKNSINDTNF